MKIAAYQFPIQATDITRGYFAKMAPKAGGDMGAAINAFANDPTDAKAPALATDPNYNGVLHTTCIATMLSGGHATNALPQRATANVNCRIFPGTTPEQVRQKLADLAGDPQIKVTLAAEHVRIQSLRALGDFAADADGDGAHGLNALGRNASAERGVMQVG